MALLVLNGVPQRPVPPVRPPRRGPRRLFILVDVRGWAFDHVASALQRHAPEEWQVEIGTALPRDLRGIHVVYNLPNFRHGQIWDRVRGCQPARPWLVGSFNTGWPHRSDRLPALVQCSDWVLFNSHWSWTQAGKLPRSSYVPNGVDTDLFRPVVPLAHRPNRMLWCGSAFHARLKGIEVARQAKPYLEARGVECDFQVIDSHNPPRSPEQQAAWYQTGRFFLCASETEGTPNTVLEAAAAGCVILSTPVGNVPQLVRPDWNGVLIQRSAQGIVDGWWVASYLDPEKIAARMAQTIADWDWRVRSIGHFAVFNALLEGRQPVAVPAPHYAMTPPLA